MDNNLQIWSAVRAVPPTAIKAITGGRLKGMSDINPVWRLKALTEQFGPCGIGWKYEITEKRLEKGGGDEVAAFLDINLYIKVDGEWSEAIPGTGGSSFVANESRGLYTNDEAFKMALTDAISVSCKALGFGADVYWASDNTKYNAPTQGAQKPQDVTDLPGKKEQTQGIQWPEFWMDMEKLSLSEAQVHATVGALAGRTVETLTEIAKSPKQIAQLRDKIQGYAREAAVNE